MSKRRHSLRLCCFWSTLWTIGYAVLLLFVSGVNISAGLAEEIQGLAAARDILAQRLDARLADDIQHAAPADFVLEVTDALAPDGPEADDRRALSVTFRRFGESFFPGTGRSPRYNLAMHDVDPRGLKLQDSKLTGRIEVTINPDAWVPSDGLPRKISLLVDAAVADLQVNGTVAISGDYGEYSGTLTGKVEPVTPPQPAAGQVTRPDAAADAAALVRQATEIYQEARAALLSLHNYPLSFSEALSAARLAPPVWGDASAPAALAYVQQLRALVEEAAQAQETADFVLETLTVDDAYFGPLFDDDPLTVADGVIVLPADAGEKAAGQHWQYVPKWNLLAVFPPDPQRHLAAAMLPELVYAPGAAYQPDIERLESTYKIPSAGTFGWAEYESLIFQIPAPGHRFHPRTGTGSHGKTRGDYGIQGVSTGRWYGAVTIRAEQATELYAAVLANNYGKLWVNNQLVWMSRVTRQPYALIKLPLRAGDNQLVLGCETDGQHAAIGLALCTRGGPLDEAERKALLQQTAAASEALPPLPVRGRQGDWTSRYPEADPPLAWNLAQGINIRWHTPLPDYSCANPVIAGDRLYVLSEPHYLYCLDKNTGKIFWQRAAHIFEFVPEDERAAAMQAWQEAETVQQSPEVKAWDEQISALERRINDMEEHVNTDEAQVAALQREARNLTNERRRFISDKTRLADRWRRELGVKEAGWSNNYGQTFAAPVADAERVWVKFGTGVAACYDKDGNRLWMVRTGLSGGTGNIASPLLLDDTFIIQGRGTPVGDPSEWREITAQWPPFFGHVMIGLDAGSGELKWRRPVSNSGGYGGATGIVPLRLSNGTTTREIILTGGGLLVDPVDGRLLSDSRGIGASTWSGDPVAFGNRAYFHRGGRIAVVEFWLEPNGKIGYRPVMNAESGGKAGMVWHAGRVWGNVGHGTVNRQPVPWHRLNCADAETGEKVITIDPALYEGGLDYAAPAAAGNYVVIIGNGSSSAAWNINPSASAEIGFARADTEVPYMASTAKVHNEAMTATPVFEDGRMYLRTYRSVMCIEVLGETGRTFQSEAKAALLFDSISERPLLSEVRTIHPVEDFVLPEGMHAEPFDIQTAPRNWLFAGPFQMNAGNPLAALGGITNAAPSPGQEFVFGGETYSFKPLKEEYVEWSGGGSEDLYGQKRYRARVTLDIGAPIERQQRSETFFYALLHNDKLRTVSPSFSGGSGMQFHLNGQLIQNGERLELPPGYYRLMVQSTITVLPPFVQKVGATLYFREHENPREAFDNWLADVRAKRPRLETVISELPDSPQARTAASMLSFLDN